MAVKKPNPQSSTNAIVHKGVNVLFKLKEKQSNTSCQIKLLKLWKLISCLAVK